MSIAVEPLSVDAGPTVHSLGLTVTTETEARWAWECPCCSRSYEAELDVCMDDGTPLRKVGFSLPFIWIG